jgi:polygalacturonase
MGFQDTKKLISTALATLSFPLCFLLCFILIGGATASFGQDTRNVIEPSFPATCAVLQAPLASNADGPQVGPTEDEQNAESKAESDALKAALASCAKNQATQDQAVELTLGSHQSHNAFLINPITLPDHISLIIDGGVTVYASRDPINYQDSTTATCGTIGPYNVNEGCLPLFTLSASNGIYGYGVIDGQGDKLLLGGQNAGTATWWDLTAAKKGKPDPQGACLQPMALPVRLSAPIKRSASRPVR